MLSTARTRTAFVLRRRAQVSLCAARAHSQASVPNVSKTNEVPQEVQNQDGRISESVEKGERFRLMQEPNRATTWSRSQRPREVAMSGPRFEQTIMELQVSEHV
jgi:NADH dehydrogenase (ubiquinone) Fe-S protein 6